LLRHLHFILPLLLFLIIILFFWKGLGRDPNLLPSMLVDKPVPKFNFAVLENDTLRFSNKDFLDQVSLLNVWATWCVACQLEHPVLMDIQQNSGIVVYGLNYKDDRKTALAYLRKIGNPYRLNIADPDGKLGIQFGVYGTPETFLIDKNGVVRYKYIGPLTIDVWEKELLPRIQKLQIGD
jgi:cytochrome c biogenesis protein CcmG/thiol:disulfide interchange protein DsbE